MKALLKASAASIFTLMASQTMADEPLRIDMMAQSNSYNNQIDVARPPSEIMCDVVALDSGFKNMRVDPRGGNYVMTDIAEDGNRYIIRDVSSGDLARDQRLYIQFAEDRGQPLHADEIGVRLRIANLFEELSESLAEYKPPTPTGPQCGGGMP
jgi:hypothetical protein